MYVVYLLFVGAFSMLDADKYTLFFLYEESFFSFFIIYFHTFDRQKQR